MTYSSKTLKKIAQEDGLQRFQSNKNKNKYTKQNCLTEKGTLFFC